ncbi:MAG: DUF1700 domain-containing protein [Clostridium sp.]|jgi:uncharacterized membrane protein|nr:DUF1700 domain-containing protein [Clostridium sp.]
MNKEEFLKELKERLEGLPSDEIENAINYYIEYFEDAKIDNEADVTISLGTAKEVAKQIMSDYSSRDSEEIIKVNLNKDNENKCENEYFPKEENNKKEKRNKWLIALIVVLAILASPIILGLAFGAIGILIGIVVTLFAIVISIIFTGGACILGGIISVIGSLFILSQVGISTAVLFIGLALISIGIGIIFLWLSIKGFKLIIYGCKKIIEKIKRRGGRDE